MMIPASINPDDLNIANMEYKIKALHIRLMELEARHGEKELDLSVGDYIFRFAHVWPLDPYPEEGHGFELDNCVVCKGIIAMGEGVYLGKYKGSTHKEKCFDEWRPSTAKEVHRVESRGPRPEGA